MIGIILFLQRNLREKKVFLILKLGSITPEADSKQILIKNDKFEDNNLLKKSVETNIASNLIKKIPNNPLDNYESKINKKSELMSNSSCGSVGNAENKIFSASQKKNFNQGINLSKNLKMDVNEGLFPYRNGFINSNLNSNDMSYFKDVKLNGTKNFNQILKFENKEIVDVGNNFGKKMNNVENNSKNQNLYFGEDKKNKTQNENLLKDGKIESYTQKFGQILYKNEKK